MSKNPGGHPTKESALAVLERRARIMRLTVEGLNSIEIEARLAAEGAVISPGRIRHDLAAVRKLLRDSSLPDAAEEKGLLLAKIALQEAGYRAAWERSKAPRKRTTTKKVTGGKPSKSNKTGDVLTASHITEERDGNPAFMAGIDGCIDRACRIHGFYAPIKVAPTTPDGTESYSGTLDVDAAAAVIRDIAARLGVELPGEGEPLSGGAAGGAAPPA